MMLAEVVANDVNWSLIFTAVMAIATFGMWLDAKKQRKVSLEQPVDIQISKALHEQFAGKQEFERHVNEVKAAFHTVAQQRSQDLQESTAARRLIYDKIDSTRKEVSEHTESVRTELGQKMDDLPDRVIATLKNTGAIGD